MNARNDNAVLLCASICGYEGEPLSLLSGILPEEGLLLLLEIRDFDFPGREKYDLITDRPQGSPQSPQMLFKREDFAPALSAFAAQRSQNTLDIPPELMRCAPDENIRLAGVSDNGKFRFDIAGLSNGNIAVLASCLFFERWRNTQNLLEVTAKLTPSFELYEVYEF